MSILIGSSRYHVPEWLSAYFPADLPEDWRLDYYANDYQIVLFDHSCEYSAIDLTENDWPDSLKLVYFMPSMSPDFTDNKGSFQQIIVKAEPVTIVSEAPEVCDYCAGAELECVLWQKVSDKEYASSKSSDNQRRIVALHDDGGDLRRLRERLSHYNIDDQETWVFLDSPPDRLEQINIMLDLMGIRA